MDALRLHSTPPMTYTPYFALVRHDCFLSADDFPMAVSLGTHAAEQAELFQLGKMVFDVALGNADPTCKLHRRDGSVLFDKQQDLLLRVVYSDV